MILVKGHNKENLEKSDFESLSKRFNSVILDLGTGDGRFVYKKALENPDKLFLGVDPVEKQLRIYSKRANRKRLKNILFVLASADDIPSELFSKIDKVYINLPWGTLLEKIIKGDKYFIDNLEKLLKKSGILEITLGYTPDLEPSETKRLDLPTINKDYLVNEVSQFFNPIFLLKSIEQIKKEELGNLESTWSKKLKHGSDRDIFKMVFEKKPSI